MFDVKWIRANADQFDALVSRRKGVTVRAENIVQLDEQRRTNVLAMNALQEKRNASSKLIGQAKANGDDAKAQSLLLEVASLKDEIQAVETLERALDAQLRDLLAEIPNLPFDDVPLGESEADNVEYFGMNGSAATARAQRPSRPAFDFAPQEHFTLGEATGEMDFEIAAKLSGSRFVVLKSHLARMERALGQFMLDLHTQEHGYMEVHPPLLVRDEVLFGTGQLPKFEDDLFLTPHGEDRLALIPTAEVPLTNMVRQSILDRETLPIRMTALTPCFRSEAGSAGRDTRGMLRQHQFDKVELVSIVTPEASADEHERMLACAEEVLKRLGLHYRVVMLCTGDLGFGARRTYDIEVWLPGQDSYREISSCSTCGDFQARRMDARYRDAEGKTQFVHTLNGSGVAVGRALIAVMENYQNEDGSVSVPDVLLPYMGGLTSIGAGS